MKNQNSKEDLYHNLPDYISGNLNDPKLFEEISQEIEINPEFKSEFEEIEKTLNFLNSAEFISPEDSYFNNLPVKINELITRETIQQSIWEKTGLVWKWLVPALSVFIIAFLLYNTSFRKSDEVFVDQTEKTVSPSTEKITEEVNQLPLVSAADDNQNRAFTNENAKNTDGLKKKKNSKKENPDFITSEFPGFPLTTNQPRAVEAQFEKNITFANSEITDIAYSDSEDDVLLISDEEENFEEELMEFTPEEQREIIENLAKSQI